MEPRQALLIYNPAARRGEQIKAQLPEIIRLLRSFQIEARALPIAELSSFSQLPTNLVLACGGDGTIHSVLQKMTSADQALGIVPLGTADALARHLSIPLDPLAAVARLMTCTPVQIPVGQIITQPQTRIQTRKFITMAGCGPDGALIHSLTAAEKARFGRAAYYTHAARLFFTRRWPRFEVRWTAPGGSPRSTPAIGLMVSRIPNLGGAFAGLTHGSSLSSRKLRAQILKPPAGLSLPAWFSLTRMRLPNPFVEEIDVDELHCEPLDPHPVYAQADAEPMGPLPFTLRIHPDPITLLMPPPPAR